MRGVLVIVLLALCVALGAFTCQRLERDAPAIEAASELTLGGSQVQLDVGVADEGRGLRRIEVRLQQGERDEVLLDSEYIGSLLGGGSDERDRVELRLDARALDLSDGDATIVIRARDWAWREGLEGNLAEHAIAVTVDTKPPGLKPVSGLTYVHRGGSAAAVYRVDGEAETHGVTVADVFYPGYRHPDAAEGDDLHVAIFAVPVEAPLSPSAKLVATDAAGNTSQVRLPAHIRERTFEESTIALDDRFLEQVALPLATAHELGATSLATSFEKVNTDLRRANEEQIRREVENGLALPQWSGAFRQMAGSKVTSRFAELRTYTYHGTEISQARHYGYDLASTSAAAITATAAGRVVFAGDLGIYGRCVIVDHGLGVRSLYGHLSSIDVAPGDPVEQDARLGRSGATGLAGGDHLHFAILVGDTYVDPIEWWDPRWVASHIAERLSSSAP